MPNDSFGDRLRLFTLFLILIVLASCTNKSNDAAHREELLKKEQMKTQDVSPVNEAEKAKEVLTHDLELLSHEERIQISLPWSKDEEIIDLLPLGETILHQPPGHPGLCVGWTHNARIIAVSDGEITSIEDDMEIPGYFTVRHAIGQYIISYQHLESVNPDLKIGPVKKGDLIGYPLVKEDPRMTNYAFHWGIKPNIKTEWIVVESLCPLTYLDDESRQRLEAVWEKSPWVHKSEFPKICNGFYEGLDSFVGLYNRSFTESGELMKPNGEIVNAKQSS